MILKILADTPFPKSKQDKLKPSSAMSGHHGLLLDALL